MSIARDLIHTINMGCRSCALSHWHGQEQRLWCKWFNKPAKCKCGNFRYEPGTDEETK